MLPDGITRNPSLTKRKIKKQVSLRHTKTSFVAKFITSVLTDTVQWDDTGVLP